MTRLTPTTHGREYADAGRREQLDRNHGEMMLRRFQLRQCEQTQRRIMLDLELLEDRTRRTPR